MTFLNISHKRQGALFLLANLEIRLTKPEHWLRDNYQRLKEHRCTRDWAHCSFWGSR